MSHLLVAAPSGCGLLFGLHGALPRRGSRAALPLRTGGGRRGPAHAAGCRARGEGPHHRHRGRPGAPHRQAPRGELQGRRGRSQPVGGFPAQRQHACRRPPQAEVRGRVPDRAARRSRAPRLRAPLPLRPARASRGERPRHEARARVCDRVRRQAGGRAVELVRLRRAARQPLLHERGFPAQREPDLPRGARPGRGGHARHRLPLAAPRGDHRHPPPRQHARLLHEQRHPPLPLAALGPHHHGLQPEVAVHPRGGRGRGGSARAAERHARRVQRRRPRGRAPEGRDPRDGRHRGPAPRAGRARGLRPPLPARALPHAAGRDPLPQVPVRARRRGLPACRWLHAPLQPRGHLRERAPLMLPAPIVSLSRAVTDALPRSIHALQHEIDERMLRIPTRLNAYGYDPWGFHPDSARRSMLITALLYHYWFRVETHDIDRIPRGRVLLISNHAGQIALDAAMICAACFFEAEPPRVVRGMGEYWLPTVPWVNELMVRTGSVVGTRKNAIDLLTNEEAVIAFPEGIRGMNKLIWERYQLQEFGQGFMRLALETDTPVVPIAVVGSEEQAIAIANAMPLARLLGIPAFPVTLTFPWLGLLGALPLPVKYRIYFGEPMRFTGNPSDEDEVIGEKVEQLKARIATMLAAGLATMRSPRG